MKGRHYILPNDWYSHGYTHPTRDEKFGTKLKNGIHPIFSFEFDLLPRGNKSKPRWGQLTLEEYGLLDQPLRLATQWLESAASSDAICSIVYGDRWTPGENPVFRGSRVDEFRQHGLPDDWVRQCAADVLERLAGSIMFKATDRDGGKDVNAWVYGRTHPSTHQHPKGIAITDRFEKKGLACKTRLHADYLIILKELLEDREDKEFQILKLYFEIAVTLCHEVVHAINFGIETDLLKAFIEIRDCIQLVSFSEPFFEGQRVAEIGFFWENHVFGGAFNQSMPDPNDAIFLGEWPSMLFRDKENQAEKAPPEKVCKRWLVSVYYIKNSLTQEFWDKVNTEGPEDLLALRVRKTVAHRIELLHDDDDFDKIWDHTDPANVPPSHGRSDRVPEDAVELTTCAKLANETFSERKDRLLMEHLLEIQRWLEDNTRNLGDTSSVSDMDTSSISENDTLSISDMDTPSLSENDSSSEPDSDTSSVSN